MDERKSEKTNHSLENELTVVSSSVLWKIKNYTGIPKKNWVSSSQFFVSGHALYLKLKRSSTCLYVYLFQEDIPHTKFVLHVVVSLIDRQGKPRFVTRKEASVQEVHNMLYLLNITESSFGKPSSILSDDTLTIRCNVSIEDDQNNIEANQHTLKEEPGNGATEEIICLETLSLDFGKYYDAHMDCDAVLRADGVDFPVHQAMLSARSSVLADMIQREVSKNNVKTLVSNIQANILDNVLFYIYSSKVRGLTTDTATPMFTAAHELALRELKDLCLKFIHSNLTTENIGDVALLAETHNIETLKQEVEKFITNNVSEVLQSRQWKEFTRQQYILANSILSNVLLSTANVVNRNIV